MTLSFEERTLLGIVSRDEVLGSELAQKTTSEDAERKWEEIQEEVRYLMVAELHSSALSHAAVQLLKNEPVETGLERMSPGTEDGAAYAEAHAFDNPCTKDPLRGLRHIPDVLEALAKTTPQHFAKNPRRAKRNALTARYYFGGAPLPGDKYTEKVFDDWVGQHFEEKRRDMLLTIAMDCQTYQAMARTRINYLYKQLRWEAALISEQAQTAKVQAELYEAQNRPDKAAEATADATARQAEAESLKSIAEKLARIEAAQSDTNQRIADIQARGARVERGVEAVGVGLHRLRLQPQGGADCPGNTKKKERMDYLPMWPMVDRLRADGKSVKVACSETLTCFGYKADARMLSNFKRECYKRDAKRTKEE